MMRLILLVGLMLGVMPAPVLAATATVRSGEHDGFTRLVIDLPAPSDWQVQKTQTGVAIGIAAGVTGFDLTRVFDRITRQRVSDVQVARTAETLEIGLACPCTVETHRNGRMVVVDVMDAVGEDGKQSRSGVFGHLFPLGYGTLTLPVLPGTTQQISSGRSAQVDPAQWRGDAELPDLSDAERRLIEGVARAASQGLIRPKTGLPGWTNEPDSHRRVQPPDRQLTARTSREVQLADHVTINGEPLGRGTCLPDGDLDLESWAGSGFHTGLSVWRSDLYGEFDRLNEAAAKGLVKHYISYGFGTEARQAMRSLAIEDPMLWAMSLIVDGQSGASDFFAPQVGCDGASVLWALLEADKIAPRAEAAAKAAVRAYWALPEALQDQIAPRLVRILSDAGLQAAANMVSGHGPHTRDATPEGHSSVTPRAPVAIETQQEALNAALSTNSPNAPDALHDLVILGIETGHPISADTATLASAFAFENRANDDGRALALTEALALAASHQFKQALTAAETITPPLSSDEWSQILDLTVKFSDDVTFLDIAMTGGDLVTKSEPETVLNVAERLLDLGFPSQAQDFLNGLPSQAPAQTRKLLSAKVALELRQPRRAEAELLGVQGAEADLLRAKARDMAGDHAAAAALFAAAQSTEQSTRSAFLAEDWQRLSQQDREGLSEFARLKTRPEARDIDGILSRNRALIDQSVEMRQAVSNLLSEFK